MAVKRSELLGGDRIDQGTQSGRGDRHLIAWSERTDSGRSACEHQVAGFQRDGRRDVAEQLADAKNEIGGRALLAELAVDASLNGEADIGLHFVAHPRTDGTERVEALGACPLAVFLLQVAGGD